ncbi:MAG TPA: DUF3105 domain-containing protein [Mycobacteriales bacterium]|nr:DUF3105 domain-containing protein [Mycobacteriales bacterium]
MGCAPLRSRRSAALALLVAGCSAGTAPEPAASAVTGLTGVATFADLSHDHIARDVTYPQTPPVGGEHWPPETADGYGWQRCAVYPEPVVDEFAVHSLEHGAVWLSYRPGAGAADVAALVALRDINRSYVLVSPVPGQPAPVMATAWGLQLSVESAADPRLAMFARTYAGGSQGGEKGADCAQGSTLEQSRAALAAAR